MQRKTRLVRIMYVNAWIWHQFWYKCGINVTSTCIHVTSTCIHVTSTCIHVTSTCINVTTCTYVCEVYEHICSYIFDISSRILICTYMFLYFRHLLSEMPQRDEMRRWNEKMPTHSEINHLLDVYHFEWAGSASSHFIHFEWNERTTPAHSKWYTSNRWFISELMVYKDVTPIPLFGQMACAPLLFDMKIRPLHPSFVCLFKSNRRGSMGTYLHRSVLAKEPCN